MNPQNPVAELFAAEAPDIIDWFRHVRDLRNDVKRGAIFAFSGLDGRSLHLTIYNVTPTATPTRRIDVRTGKTMTFGDIVEDVARVIQIQRVLAELRERRPGAQTGAHQG